MARHHDQVTNLPEHLRLSPAIRSLEVREAPFSTAMSEFLARTSLPSLPVIAITVTNQQRHSSCPAASGRGGGGGGGGGERTLPGLYPASRPGYRTERAHKARMVVNVRYGKLPGAASAMAEGPQKMGDPTSDADWGYIVARFHDPAPEHGDVVMSHPAETVSFCPEI